MSQPRTDIHEYFSQCPQKDGQSSTEYIKQVAETFGISIRTAYKQYHRHYNNLVKIRETIGKDGKVISETYARKPSDEVTDLDNYEATKLTSNPYGGQWVKYEKKQVDYLAEIKLLLEGYKPSQVLPHKPSKTTQKRALKCTLSDIHIGLSTKNDLFGYNYGEAQIRQGFDKVWEAIANQGEFDVIILQDLGDSLDGFNGLTTRGGHTLEQNMTNNEAFRLIVELKLRLIERITQSGICNKLVLLSVSNCNHSGDFGYFANHAVSIVAKPMYGVECHNYESFIGVYEYGQHTFLSCHGKDKTHMKSGLPIKLDDRTKNFVLSYIRRYNVDSKYIHFEKGDLHQLGYSKCKEFDYRNFMSFAPPSNWVQHNFGDTYSGFSLQVIEANSPNIQHTDYFLNYDNA